MNIDETIKLLESQIAEANKLLAEIKKEREKETKENTKSVLEEYWNCINSGEDMFYFDSHNEIIKGGAGLIDIYDEKFSDSNTDHYSNYPTKEYAEQAQKIKEFNDKLLAFKWCYDRDYMPVFSGKYDDRAYYIYFDSEDKKYDSDWVSIVDYNAIYFSSEEVAQKCCDWLNGVKSD